MNRVAFIASVSLISIGFTTGALALNPQPEPPGKNRVTHVPAGTTLKTIGSATGGAGAGKSSVSDDYCGTPVPGHHVNAAGTHAIIIEGKTHCNAHTTIGSATSGAGSGRAHTTTIGSATAGAGAGK